MVIFPLAPDQTIAQMWSSGARGGCKTHQTKLFWFSCLLQHSARKQDRLILQCSWAHTRQQKPPET